MTDFHDPSKKEQKFVPFKIRKQTKVCKEFLKMWNELIIQNKEKSNIANITKVWNLHRKEFREAELARREAELARREAELKKKLYSQLAINFLDELAIPSKQKQDSPEKNVTRKTKGRGFFKLMTIEYELERDFELFQEEVLPIKKKINNEPWVHDKFEDPTYRTRKERTFESQQRARFLSKRYGEKISFYKTKPCIRRECYQDNIVKDQCEFAHSKSELRCIFGTVCQIRGCKLIHSQPFQKNFETREFTPQENHLSMRLSNTKNAYRYNPY
jgi:hypothetical protein